MSRFPASLRFGPFSVAGQVFYLSPSRASFALVNLKPLLPGHVLVSPVRQGAARLSQLSAAETADLFVTVQRVARTVERVYAASALNVAVQDGADAGQSVPHVHVHIIPRTHDDLAHAGGSDAIYALMDAEPGNIGQQFLRLQQIRQARDSNAAAGGGPDAPPERRPRSAEEMQREAEWLAAEMDKDYPDG